MQSGSLHSCPAPFGDLLSTQNREQPSSAQSHTGSPPPPCAFSPHLLKHREAQSAASVAAERTPEDTSSMRAGLVLKTKPTRATISLLGPSASPAQPYKPSSMWYPEGINVPQEHTHPGAEEGRQVGIERPRTNRQAAIAFPQIKTQ